MSVSRDLWTCPECGGSERLPDALAERDAARRAAQLDHGRTHRDAGREAVPLHEALVEALSWTGGRGTARLMVHPRDVDRLRFEVARRRLRVVVCESYAVGPGRGLPLPPVAGADRRGAAR